MGRGSVIAAGTMTAPATRPAHSTGRQRADGSRPSGNSRNSRAIPSSKSSTIVTYSNAMEMAAGSDPGRASSP